MPDIAIDVLSGGGLILLTSIVVVAIIRFFPNAVGLYNANIIDQREHEQKLAEWRAQKDYRTMMLLLMAVIKQANNENIDTSEVFKILVEDDLVQHSIFDKQPKDATK